MFSTEIDTKALLRRLNAAERRQFPFALVGALNITAFETRQGWGEQIKTVFDRPTPLTVGAVLYTKATKAKLSAEIFLRDKITKGGTPPAEYLKPQEFGGARQQKPFERRFQTYPTSPKFFVPGRAAPLDRYGNLRPQVLQRIASQIGRGAVGSNESIKGKRRRLNRQRKRGGGGSFFVLSKRHGKLRPGVIYERIAGLGISEAGGASATSEVRTVLAPLRQAPRYSRRFNAIKLAQRIVAQRFERNFKQQLARALLTAK